MNFNNYFSVYHPEHLLDLLRAGAVFPKNGAFQVPMKESTPGSIREFIQNQFPSISMERYEVWLKFGTKRNVNDSYFTLEDIESAHFYSGHRQENTPYHIINSLRNYGIAVGEPIQLAVDHILLEHELIVREQVALAICHAWFGDSIDFSTEFIKQVEIGFKHQQSAVPDNLPPILSENMWARLIAYNPGLRKFEEKPNVLQLQDIQEVLKRNEQNFKDKLKLISSKHGVKLSEVIEEANDKVKSGRKLSEWVIKKTTVQNSYFSDLNELLGYSLNQQNFMYSALLYLYWREEVLNKDYTGTLIGSNSIRSFLRNIPDSLQQSTAEALFTIVYAGGPRIFQNALIEARMKILNIRSLPGKEIHSAGPLEEKDEFNKANAGRKFADFVKSMGDKISKLYSKKKEPEFRKRVQKIIKIKDLRTGDFDYLQYIELCKIFEIEPEIFTDHPSMGNAEYKNVDLKLGNESDETNSTIKADNQKTTGNIEGGNTASNKANQVNNVSKTKDNFADKDILAKESAKSLIKSIQSKINFFNDEKK